MSTCNKFTCLNEPDLETNEHKRKAKKKIREINILEKKPFKTAEEWDKINKKEYYIAILTPVEVDESQHIPNKKKKEFKQKEKNWKNTEKKLKEKIKTMEQNELDLKKMIQDFKQKEKNWKNTEKKLKETMEQNELDLKKTIQELNYYNARLKNELKQLKENKIQLQNTQQHNPVEEIIQKEFEKKKKEYNGNKDKAWRKLTTIYHPDKLKHIIGNNLATHLSQIANSLKS